jgi:(1->4)-alpha-D-glucan 1-alpha-D-glucosylmutase
VSPAPLYPIRATYRLQLTDEFGLDAVRRRVPYFAALGVSHLYLSPVFEARAGSTHGYDVTDATRVRASLGGAAAFDSLVAAAREHRLRVLLDIVPNHMGASEQGPWFRDVLEFGDASRFASHFDRGWRADPTDTRITLPVLGRQPAEALAAGEITVVADELGLGIAYAGRRFPLTPSTYGSVLGAFSAADRERLGDDALAQRAARSFARFEEPLRAADHARAARDELIELMSSSLSFRQLIERRAAACTEAAAATGDGDVRGSILAALLERQPYRLVYWRDIDRLLAYRRFFDISDLIGVRVEDPVVFEDTHARVFDWVRTAAVDGLRIDHIDGLADPTGYLIRLRARCEEIAPERPVPLLVEKVLAFDESLPATWPVDGTTGYEFLNALNGLFVVEAGLERITADYRATTGERTRFADVVYEAKKTVLEHLYAAEWRVLTRDLAALLGSASADQEASALREITACLRVYRTYVRAGDPLDAADRTRIDEAVADAHGRAHAPAAAIDRIGALLRLERDAALAADMDAVLRFVMRWQQLSGPVMAKGLEDTALYRFHPLVSINDVGGHADHGVRTPSGLHAFLAERAALLPDTLNTTSTHDTKRSEDVRARINVLAELPDEWIERWHRWSRLNQRLRERDDAPSPNEEHLFYQTLVGVWPVDARSGGDLSGRMRRYMEKALREAKVTTSWLDPVETHERAVLRFVEQVLDRTGNADFLGDVEEFVAHIAPFGALNSIAQLAIKVWAPGAPDFYQGTETWAFDLVDPDNRRPVDYDFRGEALADVERHLARPDADTVLQWLTTWTDGRIKLLVTLAALRERAAAPQLFIGGAEYVPLRFDGPGKPHFFGFARQRDGEWRMLIVPRLLAASNDLPGERARRDTKLRLPATAPPAWTDVLTGRRCRFEGGELELELLLGPVPFVLLKP